MLNVMCGSQVPCREAAAIDMWDTGLVIEFKFPHRLVLAHPVFSKMHLGMRGYVYEKGLSLVAATGKGLEITAG